MLDVAVEWLLANPLAGVGALVAFSVGLSVLFIPRVHEAVRHGHPRC